MAPKRSGVFLQNACLQHRYIRDQDLSNVVERPERLRAVNIGLAAAIAHLEELLEDTATPNGSATAEYSTDETDLAAALGKMKLESADGAGGSTSSKIPIVQSQATVDLLNNAAVKFIHGDIDGDVYLGTLKKWAKESTDKIAQGGSEIPEGYSQGDLYLCPGSIAAIQGALGTTCEAVDAVIGASRGEGKQEDQIHRAFVAVRPPGHHCGEDTPSGFCFVNNVAVAAAHAHLKHGINRVVIFDIDLHHGEDPFMETVFKYRCSARKWNSVNCMANQRGDVSTEARARSGSAQCEAGSSGLLWIYPRHSLLSLRGNRPKSLSLRHERT
ncbi:histone deacetylase clr3, variant 2 [Coprinopsis cinerea AmutBmut pab1-1]|nr:histone deacetylase clr3, variant 2 [Coprinopsis cinerea AmutBmut pab1-1]